MIQIVIQVRPGLIKVEGCAEIYDCSKDNLQEQKLYKVNGGYSYSQLAVNQMLTSASFIIGTLVHINLTWLLLDDLCSIFHTVVELVITEK